MNRLRYTLLARAGMVFVLSLVVNLLSGCGSSAPLTATSMPTLMPSQAVQPSPTTTPIVDQPHTNEATGPLFQNPDNPRYFTDGTKVNGKYRVMFLSGSHFWDNLQDSGTTDQLPYLFDYSGWLDFLQARNHNFFRLWMWEQAKWVVESSTPYYWTPLPYQRTGLGNATDGQPKFDLTKFNEEYFDRMRARIIEAGHRGIYVSVMLFDGWSVAYPKSSNSAANPWEAHPFNKSNNVNNIEGDPNHDDSGDEIQQLSISEITAFQEAYVRKVIDTVSDLDNVLYEIANESNGCGNEVNWQYHLIDYIKTYESNKEKQHPVGMTIPYPCGDNAVLFASENHADWVSPNGDLNNPPVADGNKVIVADTDHLCGICGDRSWAWKSFTRGQNLLFMDQYDDSYKLEGGGFDINNDENLRYNLGYIRTYANRMNLAAMTPQPALCSTGYCLANAAAENSEILVYLPAGSTATSLLRILGMQRKDHERIGSLYLPSDSKVTVDISYTRNNLAVEWFDPETGDVVSDGTVTGGDSKTFTAPFSNDAILYLYDVALSRPTPTATPTLIPPSATPTTESWTAPPIANNQLSAYISGFILLSIMIIFLINL